MAMPMRLVVYLAICMTHIRTHLAEPCENYMTFEDPKRSKDYPLGETDVPICDMNTITDGLWYRFLSNVGGKISEECVDINMCGTVFPLWIDGTHPTDSNIKTVPVCLSQGTSDCCTSLWTETINIKRCEESGKEYFVYQLKPGPTCPAAYCAGEGEPCSQGLISVPGIGCTDECPNVESLPEITGPFVTYHAGAVPERFHFECRASLMTMNDVSFRIKFFFDGSEFNDVSLAPVDDVVVAGHDPVAKLYDYQLRGRLGKYISCSAQPFYTLVGNDDICEAKTSSNNYWAGIRIDTDYYWYGSPVTLGEYWEEVDLPFKSTIPVFCPIMTRYSLTGCAIEFALSAEAINSGTNECRRSVSNENFPGSPSYIIPWNLLTSAQNMLKISATPDDFMKVENYQTAITFAPILIDDFNGMSLSSNNMAIYPIYGDYILDPIKVQITGDYYYDPWCYSHGDPYVQMFDGNYFATFALGDFRYVYNTQGNDIFEIQVRQQPCGAGIDDISCNCAVAIREGNSVLGIDMCQRPLGQDAPNFIRYLEGESAIGADIFELWTNAWIIIMPSGAQVEVHYNDWSPNRSILNLFIKIPGNLFDKVDGVCGKYNGYSNNDPYNLGIESYMEQFRIPQEDSFFAGPPDCEKGQKEQTVILCQCIKETSSRLNDHPDKIVCESVGKEVSVLSPGYKCTAAAGRKRRAIEDLTDDFISDEDLYSPAIVGPGRPTPLDMVWEPGRNIDENLAIALCSNIYQSSPSFSVCESDIDLDQLMTECLSDLYLMDDTTLLRSKEAKMQNVCIAKKKSRITLGKNNTEETVAALAEVESITSDICPNMCSGKGVCENSTCVCNYGFIGDDCSLETQKPPQIKSIKGNGRCDKSILPCQRIRLQVKGVNDSPQLSCKFTGHNVLPEEGLVTVTHTNQAIYSSSIEIICQIPPMSAYSILINTTAFMYQLSISNDGVLFSESVNLVRYDGHCISCSNNNGQHICSLKADQCAIGGRCYPNGTLSFEEECESCQSGIEQFTWTKSENCDSTPKSTPSTSTLGIPGGTWEAWTEWGPCDKTCDIVLRHRYRTCRDDNCPGVSQENGVCMQRPCEESPIENANSVVIDVPYVAFPSLLDNMGDAYEVMAIAVNDYCSQFPRDCCSSAGFLHNSLSTAARAISNGSDYEIISGYPAEFMNDGPKIRIKVVGEYHKQDIAEWCQSNTRVKRQSSNDLEYIEPRILLSAFEPAQEEIEKALGVPIIRLELPGEESSDKPPNWIYYVVGCVGVLLVAVVIVVVVACKFSGRSRKTSGNHGEKSNIIGQAEEKPNMTKNTVYQSADLVFSAPPTQVVFPEGKNRPLSPIGNSYTKAMMRPASPGGIIVATGIGPSSGNNKLPPLPDYD